MPNKVKVRKGAPTKIKRGLRQFVNDIIKREELDKVMSVLDVDKKRERTKPIKCSCCARQMVPRDESTDRTVSGWHATVMGPGIYACHECSTDLDENGMFPEER